MLSSFTCGVVLQFASVTTKYTPLFIRMLLHSWVFFLRLKHISNSILQGNCCFFYVKLEKYWPDFLWSEFLVSRPVKVMEISIVNFVVMIIYIYIYMKNLINKVNKINTLFIRFFLKHIKTIQHI